MKGFFSFPNPVNEAAARTVAIGVVTMSSFALAFNWAWMLIPLTYGFLARVAAGPKISPLGRFAVSVAAPAMERSRLFRSWVRFTPGPPKRFAQAMGAAFTVTASILWATNGWSVARWILVPLIVAASLEGFFGYCLGCKVFALLMRTGLIPEEICAECADISLRRRPTQPDLNPR